MSYRLSLLTTFATCAAFMTPALAIQTNFSTVMGSSTPLTLPSGDNTLTFSSPTDPGAFSVGSTTGLFSFSTALGDFSSFGGDTLMVTFAKPVTSPLLLTFGLEDAFGLNGSDTLSVVTNTGASYTLATTLNAFSFPEPEGSGVIAASGLTSLALTSLNPFAIASISTVPEPASLALLASGVLGIAFYRRRR